MNWTRTLGALGIAGAATLIYGALVESKKLTLERRVLKLKDWPSNLSGYRICLLGDLHLRDRYSVELAEQAVAMALDTRPDQVVLIGDFVGYWKPESLDMLRHVLSPLQLLENQVLAVPGNHEYWGGTPDLLVPLFEELGIRLLRNQTLVRDGIEWIGIDSTNAGKAKPPKPRSKRPRIALWHEPDSVDLLPYPVNLMLSGHSHGGQFTFPWGYTPMHTKGGSKYVRGFYPSAPSPIYVTRGVGTTGPPSRLCCNPEVSLLELVCI